MTTDKSNRNGIPRVPRRKSPFDRVRTMLPLTFRGQAVLFLIPIIVLMSMVYTIVSISTERTIMRNELIEKGETIPAGYASDGLPSLHPYYLEQHTHATL